MPDAATLDKLKADSQVVDASIRAAEAESQLLRRAGQAVQADSLDAEIRAMKERHAKFKTAYGL